MIDCNGTELKAGDKAIIVNATNFKGTPMPDWSGLLVEIAALSEFQGTYADVKPLEDRPDQKDRPEENFRRYPFVWPANQLLKFDGAEENS